MTRYFKIAAVLAIVAGTAYAATPVALEIITKVFRAGFYVGAAGISADSDNHIKESLGECATVDYFGTDAGAAAVSCDFQTVTKAGVAVGDPCFASRPRDADGGVIALSSPHAWYECEVRAPGVIQASLCAFGVTGNPDAGTQCFRTISSQ
jgi:hypothetical protein